jgi:hypothetical protein
LKAAGVLKVSVSCSKSVVNNAHAHAHAVIKTAAVAVSGVRNHRVTLNRL